MYSDKYQIDNLIWSSQNIFAALLELHRDSIVITKNQETINNGYRYVPYPPIFYFVSNLYHPRNRGKGCFDFYFEKFIRSFDRFGRDLKKVEVLTLCYSAFSPLVKYPILTQQSIPRIAYGVRLSTDSYKESIVVMSEFSHSLFYLEDYQFNIYFGGKDNVQLQTTLWQ